MPLITPPLGKGGTGVGNKLAPIVTHAYDLMEVGAGSGYDFSAGTATHYLALFKFSEFPTVLLDTGPPVAPDNNVQSIPFTETTVAGEYTFDPAVVGGYYLTLGDQKVGAAAPTGAAVAAAIFSLIDNGGGAYGLSIHPGVFNTQHDYYLVGVGRLAAADDLTGVGTAGNELIDYQMICVVKDSLDVFDTTATGIDTATLDIALALAGHNIKVRNPTTIDGQTATRHMDSFSRANDYVTDPTLLDPADNTGETADVNLQITSTPDAKKNIAQDLTFDG